MEYDHAMAAALAPLMQAIPEAKASKMFGMPAYKVGGKLAVSVTSDGVVAKLGAERARTLIGTEGITTFEPMGRAVWKDWIKLTGDLARHQALLEEAVRYVADNR